MTTQERARLLFDEYDGCTSNDGSFKILAAAAGYIELAAGSLTTEVAGDQVILSLSTAEGASRKSSVIAGLTCLPFPGRLTPITTEGASPLVSITKNGSAFVSGAPANGLNFTVDASGNVIVAVDPATDANMIMKGVGLVAESALFGRLYANTVVTGASTSAVRMDGRVGVSGVEINL